MIEIFHPTDLSRASEVAFNHALKVTLALKGKLTVFHVSDNPKATPWEVMPGVRTALARWGLIPEDAPREAVRDLGIDVLKVMGEGGGPVKASAGYLEDNPADILVLATHHVDGQSHWLDRSVALPVVRRAHAMTLFLPHGVEGFVDSKTGAVTLEKILMPVVKNPHPQPAINALDVLLKAFGLNETVEVSMLHIGEPGDAPSVELPAHGNWTLESIQSGDDPSDIISNRIKEAAGTDLIVMTTKGPHGFLDALRGTTTEQVVRHGNRPVLAIPSEF